MIEDAQARKLVRELYERVDGGQCTSCTSEAIDALKIAIPEIDWDAHWEALKVEEGYVDGPLIV